MIELLRDKRTGLRVIEFYELDIGSSAISDNACARVTAGGPTPSLRDKERVTSGNLDNTRAEGTSDSCRRPRNERSEPKTVDGHGKSRTTTYPLCGLLHPFSNIYTMLGQLTLSTKSRFIFER